MAISEKALTEGPASGGPLVPPKYGVGDSCPHCGFAMARMPSGEIACKNCGHGMKKAVGFVVDQAASKDARWEMKEAQLDGVTGLTIKGYASTWTEDRDGDTVARHAFDATLKSYLEDNPVLLLDHKRDQVLGQITKAATDDVGLAVEAFVPKPDADEEKWKITAYRDIKRGLRKALSIGGVFYRASEKSARNVIEKVDLFEISNIAVPSNPKSLFRVIAEKGLSFMETKESAAEINDLPDSDFAFIEPGGEKDGEGKTTPRSLRHFPIQDADHVRNALARAGQSPFGDKAMPKIRAAAAKFGIDVSEKGAKGTPANAPAEDDQDADDLVHTHAKAGGGTEEHSHADPDPGHRHPGLLPLPEGKAATDNEYNEYPPGSQRPGDFRAGDKCPTCGEPLADTQYGAGLSCKNGHSVGVDETDENDDDTANASRKNTPLGGNRTMGEEVGTKGAKSEQEEGAAGAKTVTLSAEEFAAYQADIKAFQDLQRQKQVEETAEAIAAKKLAEQEKAAQLEMESKQAFANEVAQMVEAKMAGSRSGRKYVVPQSGGGLSAAHEQRQQGSSMIELLYRKSQGDPEARQELREISQKAAAEYGVKALYESGTSGYLVPPQYMQSGIAEYRIAAAKVRQLCTVIGGIGTNLVYIPRETGIATVGWTAEGAPKPSTDQTMGQLAVNIFTLAGISKVSKQLLDDSSPAVDMLVRKDLGRLLGQAEDIAFLVGTGAGQPTGILNTTGILTGALGTATIADALASGIAAIQANYYGDPEAIVMNPRHLNVIRTAKDSNLRYIFEPSFFAGADPRMRQFMDNNGPGGPNGNLGGGYSNMPSQGGPQGTVWGLPVYADANLPAVANQGNIIVGAFSEAYILERTGVTIDVSAEAGTSFEQNQVWYRGEERLGFTAARQPTAFYAITTVP